MKTFRRLLLLSLGLLCGPAAHAGEIGIVTLVEGTALVLRGASWYKLPPGARLEDGDIVEPGERAQVQIEFADGNAANLVGPASLYLAPASTRAGAPSSPAALVLPRGWLKLATKGTGMRVRTATADLVTADGVLVIHEPALEVFAESGSARLIERLPSGAEGAAREVKRGEFWAKQADGAFAVKPRAPRAFVDAMPRHFFDPLPSLAFKFAARPVLAVDHDVTYAEAEPWLASRDRAAFEKRFTSRLRDPAFRKAVEPSVARYPTWDRMLHPEKYAPKPKTAPTPSAVGRSY